MEVTDKGFGRITDDIKEIFLERGDDRSSFVKTHMGHRDHHLYLWLILDTHDIMSDVLIGLNKNVAMDCENIHTDTSVVQNPRGDNKDNGKESHDAKKKRKKRKKGDADDKDDKQERGEKEKRIFRFEIKKSVKDLAGSAERDTKIRKVTARISILTANLNREAGNLARLKDRLYQEKLRTQDLRVKGVTAVQAENEKLAELYKQMVDSQEEIIAQGEAEMENIEDDISSMKYSLAKLDRELNDAQDEGESAELNEPIPREEMEEMFCQEKVDHDELLEEMKQQEDNKTQEEEVHVEEMEEEEKKDNND